MSGIKGRLAAMAICAIMAGYASHANAQWYISGNVGASSLDDSDYIDTAAIGSATGNVEFDGGIAATGAIGYALKNFRVEGEVSYRRNDLDLIRIDTVSIAGLLFTNVGSFDIQGETTALSGMINGWYEFDTKSKWVPFVGGGVGVSHVNLNIDSIAGIATNFDESDTVFAYQVGAGIGYNVNEKMTVTFGYRYFATADPEGQSSTDKIETEYSGHNLLVGINYRF